MEKLTEQERQQQARTAKFVARILEEQGQCEIPIGILSGQECDIVTDEMRARFWKAVDETRTPRELFKAYARAAVRNNLLIITNGLNCCGGGAGYDFLQVPPDFTERVKQFLGQVKQFKQPVKKGSSQPAQQQRAIV